MDGKGKGAPPKAAQWPLKGKGRKPCREADGYQPGRGHGFGPRPGSGDSPSAASSSSSEEEMDPGVPWNHGAKAPPVALRRGWFDPRPGPPGSRLPTQSSTDGSRSVAGSGGARPDMVGRWNLIGYTRVGMNKAGIQFF